MSKIFDLLLFLIFLPFVLIRLIFKLMTKSGRDEVSGGQSPETSNDSASTLHENIQSESCWEQTLRDCYGDFSFYVDDLEDCIEEWRDDVEGELQSILVDGEFLDLAAKFGFLNDLKRVAGDMKLEPIYGLYDQNYALFSYREPVS